jgi:hypothetical protein
MVMMLAEEWQKHPCPVVAISLAEGWQKHLYQAAMTSVWLTLNRWELVLGVVVVVERWLTMMQIKIVGSAQESYVGSYSGTDETLVAGLWKWKSIELYEE